MTRSVRIKEHLASEVERLAKEGRRSLASMVEILLEQALKMDGALSERDESGGRPISSARSLAKDSRSESDPHFKPDFK